MNTKDFSGVHGSPAPAPAPRQAQVPEPGRSHEEPAARSAAARKTLQEVLDCLRQLVEAKRQIDADMGACLKRIWALARAKRVTARPKRDPDGLLRRIHFVLRSKGRAHANGQDYPQHETLRAPINRKIVETVIRDLPRIREWLEVYRDGTTLNSIHAIVAICHRDFRAALQNRFCPEATHEDRLRAAAVLRTQPFLALGDHEAVVGAVVFDRLLKRIEGDISALVLRWKESMRAVPFEPLIRWRPSGALRLSWAYVERFYDSQRNPQVRSVEIPGGVTDRWLRSHLSGGGAARRRAILGYAAPLRKLVREYSRLLVYVGRLKARVRRALEEDVSGVRPVAGAGGYRSD